MLQKVANVTMQRLNMKYGLQKDNSDVIAHKPLHHHSQRLKPRVSAFAAGLAFA